MPDVMISGVTDAEGNFAVPKYTISFIPPSPEFEMGIYKKGYVVWSNEYIIYPERYEDIEAGKRKSEELLEDIRWELKNGSIVRMRPWKKGYSEEVHADYVCTGIGLHLKSSSRLFDEAIERECLLDKYYSIGKLRGEKYPD